MQKNILWLSEIEADHLPEVGSGLYSLSLAHGQNIPVLNSFVISSRVFEAVLSHNKVSDQINHIFGSNLFSDEDFLQEALNQVNQRIDVLDFPNDIVHEIFSSYFKLGQKKSAHNFLSALDHFKKSDPFVTVTSKSFSKKITVVGESNLIFAIRELWKSHFSLSSVKYLRDFSHIMATAPSIIVSESIESPNKIVVEGNLIKNSSGKELADEQINQIQQSVTKMNKYLYFPNNYEFAVSKNQIYLTKITPHTPQTETVATTRIFFIPPSPQKPPTHREWKEILTGKSLSRGAKIGHVKIINKIGDLHKIRHGDIVVAHSLSAPMFSAFRKSGAVILEKTPFQHNDYSFIIKSGIPIISDVQNASKLLYENQLVMVASKEGKVYSLN